jgi:hypothetical protein
MPTLYNTDGTRKIFKCCKHCIASGDRVQALRFEKQGYHPHITPCSNTNSCEGKTVETN